MTPLHDSRGAAAGFTLVEMLIALVLLSMLMLILTGAMYTVGQTESRMEQRIESSDDYRLASDLMAQILGRVSARQHAVQMAVAGLPPNAPFFDAQPNSLSWIGVLPARHGLGGRHYLHLGIERVGNSSALVLRYLPWFGLPVFDDWAQASSQVLAMPATELRVFYQEPLQGAWSETWPPPGADLNFLPPNLLPSAVMLEISGTSTAWAPIVVPVVPTFASDTFSVGPEFGGGS